MVRTQPRISRGSSRAATFIAAEPPISTEVAARPKPREQAGLAGDAQARLDALERLGRLRASGLLTQAEFDEQKALLLGHSQTQTGPDQPLRRQSVHPSLLGRLCNWKFLPIGLVAGLALSFGTQPQETISFLDQALGLVGA